MPAPKLRPRLSRDELAKGVESFPAILRPSQLAAMTGICRKTIYLWLAQGRLDPAARKRGKHWLIARDKALDTLFNGADWK